MFDETTDAGDAPLPWWLDVDLIDFDDWADEDPGQSGTLAGIASRPLGPWHLTGLLNIDRSMLSPNDSVTYLQEWDRAAAWMAGQQATVTADTFTVLLDNTPVTESVGSSFVLPEAAASAEAAAALRISPRSADERVFQALDLTGPMTALHDALTSGHLSFAHVSAVRRELLRLPTAGNPALAEQFAHQCASVLASIVPFAKTHTPGQAAKKTRTLVSAVDPEGTRNRRREITEQQHGVFLRETEPGTCELTAVMPTLYAHALLGAINALAKDDRFETADGCVTLGQRRVAAMVQLTLSDPGSVGCVSGPVREVKLTAHLNVIVPLSTVLASQAHAGSIGDEAVPGDALWDAIAEMDPNSTFRRLVTDDAGAVIDAGRTRYAISDIQRRIIELRDSYCRFPGCTTRADRCDIDHAKSWDDGGGTDLDNLGSLCRRHHQLKTHGSWRITRSGRNGACTWRSPLGRVYEHQPPDLLLPPLAFPIDDTLTPF